MESLPLELLHRVFELACTDGGHTGNALSAVSKRVRAAARRTRFHTLRLAAYETGFEEFVALLKRECDHDTMDRPRVRHLYLRLSGVTWKDPLWVASPAPSSETESAVQELVKLVAPDLYSLVIHIGPFGLRGHHQFPILEHAFPLVREASFVGIPGPARLMAPDAQLTTAFPSATHLHLTPDSGARDLYLDSWAALAPRVTHLRVSGVHQRQHVTQLAEAVGVDVSFRPFAAPAPARLLPPRTYPSVRYLLVAPTARPRRGKCGNPRIEHGVMRGGLRDLVDECGREDADARAVLLAEPDDVPVPQRDETLFKEWAERVEGGEGWWKGLELN